MLNFSGTELKTQHLSLLLGKADAQNVPIVRGSIASM